MRITFGTVLWALLFIILIGYAIFWLYNWMKRKDAATMLSQAEFDQTKRQAQVIDVRESNDYHSAHIVGARNIPYSTVSQGGVPGLNKKQPIYLYDNGVTMAGRFANKLKANNELEVSLKTLIIEGLLSIQAGENPRVIEEKLKSFLAPDKRDALSSDNGGEE